MIPLKLLKSKVFLLILAVGFTLDLQKPGYMVFANPLELIETKECKVQKTFNVPVLPWLQKGLSEKTSIYLWKRRLGKPVCYLKDQPLWQVPEVKNGFYLGLSMDSSGIVTGYDFYQGI